MRRLLAAAVIAMMGMGVSASSVRACDTVCVYKKVVCYETVTECVTRQVPYEKAVTRYDHCGQPYVAYVTCYRSVQVAVQKRVPVTKWGKVCYEVED